MNTNLPIFTESDFDIFRIDGLDNRMIQIKEVLKPKFLNLGKNILSEVTFYETLHLHIAKHMRRTVNPPKDTWFAISNSKRGYKMLPHFQFGLYNDHAFIWLSFLNEISNKNQIGNLLMDNIDLFDYLYSDEFVISMDHTKKDFSPLTSSNLISTLNKFSKEKKSEFLIGKRIEKDNIILKNSEKLYEFILKTINSLSKIYVVSLCE